MANKMVSNNMVFRAEGNLLNEVVIGKRHVWLWHITSENGVVDMYLLQYEKKDMEIVDELYSNRDVPEGVVASNFEYRATEILRESLEDSLHISNLERPLLD